MTSSRKTSTQCPAAVMKVNSMLGLIRKEMKTVIIIALYKKMVQPHLEYVMATPKAEDLEKVQHRATKTIRGLEHLPNEERPQHLEHFSLEKK